MCKIALKARRAHTIECTSVIGEVSAPELYRASVLRGHSSAFPQAGPSRSADGRIVAAESENDGQASRARWAVGALWKFSVESVAVF